MSSSVGDNPVILSGVVVAAEGEQLVIGDDHGNTLTFRWADEPSPSCHGTPSGVVVDLPAGGSDGRAASECSVRFETGTVLVRYAVECVGDMRVVSYTMCEDVRAEFIEATAPGMVDRSPGEASRISTGPD